MYGTLRRKCYLYYLYNFKETLFILFIELYEGNNNIIMRQQQILYHSWNFKETQVKELWKGNVVFEIPF